MRPASFGAFWDIQKAQEEAGDDTRASTYAALAESAFWADSGERVFASWRDVMAWPMRDANDLMSMLNICAEINMPATDKKTANGVDPSGSRPSGTSPTA
jgi:hypothetical protein